MPKERFSRNELQQILSQKPPEHPLNAEIATGIGYYRNLYRKFGKEAWSLEPAKAVQHFFELENPDLDGKNVIDLGAGTGKNIIEFVRRGVARAMAVEIDTIAARELLDTVMLMEENGLIEEGIISVSKDDVRTYLATNSETFDFAVSYGLLHVFRNPGEQKKLLGDISRKITSDGYLIIQSLTNKYPAPRTQPELEGITVTENDLHDFFTKDSRDWKIKYYDNTDITHSHAGSEEDHKHGSVRIICQKS